MHILVDQTIVDKFSNEMSRNDYYGALETLVNADESTRRFIVSYLKSKANVDPVKVLIHDAILQSGNPGSVVMLASKLGYADYARGEARRYEYSMALKELAGCASRKDWACADRVISKYRSIGDKSLAEAFIYMVSDKIGEGDLRQLNDFAKKHGLEGLYQIVNGILTVNTERLEKDAIGELTAQLMDDIEKAIKTGDIRGLEEKYGDILDRITIQGRSLRDIIQVLPTVKALTDYDKKLLDEVDWVNTTLQKVLSGKGRVEIGRVDSDIGIANRALQLIALLKPYNGIVVKNLDDIERAVKSILARLYLLKGAYYYENRNPSAGDEWLGKALPLDRSLAEAVTAVKLMRPASMDELLCIIRNSGLLGGSHASFHIKRYGTTPVGSHGVYAR